ncbi:MULTISPECIES: hypothetical protein [Asaia]|uniref:hypothetical protein n=1 Tax=Asaia TaxID=91914 RepID=UPI00255337FE|nr:MULTISPECIES: hypothetical protein [Asaia]MDL2172512.1 hypothetical protein [Asaia sp. HumB]MDR6184065.1 hypothetical protein [Asaia bogorensis NBRC 16594]
MTMIAMTPRSALHDALRRCERGEWQHSALYLWMVENFEMMERSISGGRVRWGRIADAAYADGLRARHGGPAAVNTVKSTWYRVRKAVRAALEKREAEDAARQYRRDATAAKLAQETADREAASVARAGAERELEIRQIAERGFPPTPAAPSSAPVSAAVPTMPVQVSSETTAQDDAPGVVIGQIKRPVKMLEAAPRYGEDRFKPLPPCYVGPRPAGMPENLPLEALTPLDATGLTSDGGTDFEQIPGLPRMSFFERQSDWARACVPMIEAVPREKRSLMLKGMLLLVKGYARNF